MKPITEAALRQARNRRPVFPCGYDKAPGTPNGFKDATIDPRVIERWFERMPDALLAIPTGRVSGLVVLDVDGEDGWASIRRLEHRYEPLPATASVKTPRGGQHFYFRWPGAEVRCSASAIAPHIDVRGDGGYVVIPPSRLPDGREYVVDEEAPAAEMPIWLRALVASAPNGNGKRTPPSEWLKLVRDGVGEGKRNAELARFVGHLLRHDINVDLVAELAHLVNAHRFRPPLDRDEVDRTINSIAGAKLRRRTSPQ